MTDGLELQLAASQAREKVLRNALVNAQAYAPCPMYIDALNQPTDDTALNKLLAEGQAREEVLRAALLDCEDQMSMADGGCANCSSYPSGKVELCVLHEALSKPINDTALKDALAAEREKSIAAFKKHILPNDHTHFTDGWNACIEEAERAIRALGARSWSN